MAGRTGLVQMAAGALLVIIIVISALPSPIGRLLRTTAVAPWRLARASVDLRAAVAVSLVSLTIVGLIAMTLTGFTAPEIGATWAGLLGVVALVFEGVATWPAGSRGRGRLLVSACGSMMPAAAVLLGTIAYLGPLGVWYWFWTSPAFRVVLLTVGCASAFWTAFVLLLLSVRAGERWRGRIAGALSAVGVALVALALLLPDGTVALRALDRPLNLAPATDTMLFALRTYAGVSLEVGGWLLLPGAALLVAGMVLSLTQLPTAAHRSVPSPT